jgi:hypothetical protein
MFLTTKVNFYSGFIVSAMSALISKNTCRLEKKIWTKNQEGVWLQIFFNLHQSFLSFFAVQSSPCGR